MTEDSVHTCLFFCDDTEQEKRLCAKKRNNVKAVDSASRKRVGLPILIPTSVYLDQVARAFSTATPSIARCWIHGWRF